MHKIVLAVVLAWLGVGMPSRSPRGETTMTATNQMMKRATPVLFVPEVEPCLKFWERLGFTRAMEVPDGNALAFAAVQQGAIEIMYQSYASAEKDASTSPATRGALRSSSFLYVETPSLDAVLVTLKGAPIEVGPHNTFYGSREATLRDPAGHFITFAEFPQKK